MNEINTGTEALMNRAKELNNQRKSRHEVALDYQQPNRILNHVDQIYKLKHGLYSPPVQVEVSPTSICQQECRFCYTFQREHTNMLDDNAMFAVQQKRVSTFW